MVECSSLALHDAVSLNSGKFERVILVSLRNQSHTFNSQLQLDIGSLPQHLDNRLPLLLPSFPQLTKRTDRVYFTSLGCPTPHLAPQHASSACTINYWFSITNIDIHTR